MLQVHKQRLVLDPPLEIVPCHPFPNTICIGLGTAPIQHVTFLFLSQSSFDGSKLRKGCEPGGVFIGTSAHGIRDGSRRQHLDHLFRASFGTGTIALPHITNVKGAIRSAIDLLAVTARVTVDTHDVDGKLENWKIRKKTTRVGDNWWLKCGRNPPKNHKRKGTRALRVCRNKKTRRKAPWHQ